MGCSDRFVRSRKRIAALWRLLPSHECYFELVRLIDEYFEDEGWVRYLITEILLFRSEFEVDLVIALKSYRLELEVNGCAQMLTCEAMLGSVPVIVHKEKEHACEDRVSYLTPV